MMNVSSSDSSTSIDTAPSIPENRYVLHRRFDRMGRLVGDSGMKSLFASRVMVIGLGGVGSWAAESLVRSGIGEIHLVDFDEICITNANRQLQALQGMVGKKKAEVLAERLAKINPQAKVAPKVQFYNAETSSSLLEHRPDFVLDCIDNLTAKAHLLAALRDHGIPVISSTGAAARLDPSLIHVADLADSHTDPMAAQLRKILRTRHDFPSEGSFGIPCVFSSEKPRDPVELHYDLGQGFRCVCPQGQNNLHSCEHRNVIYGTASFVTGAFGLHMASFVVRSLLGELNPKI